MSDRYRRMELVCASYNVHRYVGRDGRRDPQRIRAVLTEMNAHVIALQEVEANGVDADILGLYEREPGWTAIAGPTLQYENCDYGNALLTRLPVITVERIELGLPDFEPRGALDVIIDAGGAPVRVLATHLGLTPGERRTQIRRLLAHLDAKEDRQDVAPAATILMGDINEWFLWGRPLRWLHAHFETPPSPPTFPSGWPLLALDRIWVKPRRRLLSVKAWRSALARIASDHLPVMAAIGPGS